MCRARVTHIFAVDTEFTMLVRPIAILMLLDVHVITRLLGELVQFADKTPQNQQFFRHETLGQHD